MRTDPINPLTNPTQTTGKPYALVVLLQLYWFIRLRWVFAAAALGLLAIERFLAPHTQRPWKLLACVLAVAATNVLWTIVSRLLRRQLHDPRGNQRLAIRSGQLFASAQIASDLFLLTCILALTGGVESPMSLFYLFHVAITGLLLRTWQAFLLSLWAVLLYTAMGIGHATGWLPYYPLFPTRTPADLYNDPQYVALAVSVVALAAFGTLYFTDRIGKILDMRQDMLIRMNAALELSRQAIQDLQQRRSRFMQTAAHQLKSPLAMVQTLANLIRDGIVVNPQDVHATCEKIINRCRDGIGQVTELLTLARVQEADPARHRDSRTNVIDAVGDLHAKYLPGAREKKIDLRLRLPDEATLAVRVFPDDFLACVGNLIENAIKYTPEGGLVSVTVFDGEHPPGDIELPPPPSRGGIRARPEEHVYVVVQDTGIGLDEPPAYQDDGTLAAGSVFDAFRRGRGAVLAGIPGTGLGLSIVREVVEQSGGYIHVRSYPGEGSTFTVAFPADASAVPAHVRDTRSSHIVVERPMVDAGGTGGMGPPAAQR